MLTLKAARLLGLADAVVFDALVAPAILELARPGAELRYVGKRGGRHDAEQEEINELLAGLARRLRVVVRLKGGDPYLFGRGAEEQEHLAAAGVPVEVVPGVTSAVAVPAYAGIPLTHRDHAPMAVIATGHRRGDGDERPVDWARVGALGATVSVLMGVRRLEEICGGLMAGGRSPETPAALIEWGTTPRQRVLVATLASVAERASAEGLEPPSVLVVGEVVALQARLDWFHRRPLRGSRVLVAASGSAAGRLAEALEAVGAEPVRVPTRGGSASGALPIDPYERLSVGLAAACFLDPEGARRALDAVGVGRIREALAADGALLAADRATADVLAEAGLEAEVSAAPTLEALIELVTGRLGAAPARRPPPP